MQGLKSSLDLTEEGLTLVEGDNRAAAGSSNKDGIFHKIKYLLSSYLPIVGVSADGSTAFQTSQVIREGQASIECP